MAGNRLMKMYLFNEDTFRKVQERLAEEKNYNDLDKAMKKVLGRKISSNEKWLLYRHELQKFLNLRRRMMGYDAHRQTDQTPKKKKSFFGNVPVRKTKTFNISTDTKGLPQTIKTRKHQHVQTHPDLRAHSTQTRIPIQFNQETQVQPETSATQTDTSDLPPAEDYLSLSMLDEDNVEQIPVQGRLSSAYVANRLIKTEPLDHDATLFDEDNPMHILDIYGNKYQVPFEDIEDFRDFSIEFHRTHPEGAEMDMDDFDLWLARRRVQQAALEQSPAPAVLRMLHGPYRERRVEGEQASTSNPNRNRSPKKKRRNQRDRSRSHSGAPSGNIAQNTITSHFRQIKKRSANQKGGQNVNRIKWTRLR